MMQCSICEVEGPDNKFPITYRRPRLDGTVRVYRRKQCRRCLADLAAERKAKRLGLYEAETL